MFFGKYEEESISKLLSDYTSRKPLSKFGIEPIFEFGKLGIISPDEYFGYTLTNTHSYIKGIDLNSDKVRILSDICIDLNETDYL
jgi:hypothetical protein